jgi:hypothetical protein
VELYEALENFYSDLENGYTLSEALENNADLEYAIEISSDLEEAIDELYEAIEDGVSVADAIDLYGDTIDTAIDAALDLIVDETV